MAKKASKKSKKQTNPIKKEKTKTIIGIFLLALSVYLLLAFISFLFTWQTDLSKFNMSFFNYLSASSTTKNFTGKLGADLAILFIHKWFGISAFGLIYIFALIGLKLLNIKIRSFWKKIINVFLIMLWLTLFMALLFKDHGFYLGGAYGVTGIEKISSILGGFGTTIFLLLLLIIYIFIVFERSYEWTKKTVSSLTDKQTLENLKNSVKISNITNGFKSKISEIISKDEQPEQELNDDLDQETSSDEKQPQTEQTIIDEQELNPFYKITGEEKGKTPVKKFVVEDDANGDNVKFDIDFSNLDKQQAQIHEQAKNLDDKLHQRLNMEVSMAEDVRVDEILQDYDPTKSLPNYKFPPITLLNDYSSKIDKNELIKELKQKKQRIVEVLKNFKIDIVKITAQVGPTVTLYEIVPAPGVPISKITRREEDIAMNLAALGIRIIAPMPGRGTVGIEVPNKHRSIVSFKDIILSPEYTNDKYELPIALGKDTVNQPFVFDLAKAPHVLMAGSTGEGKSVAINVIINSILFKKHPALVKFVLIDPKQVELSLYSKLEHHYLATLPDAEEPIVTEVKEAARVLKSLIAEMEDRYRLLKLAKVRNIIEYNHKFIKRKIREKDGHRFMPYIITIIDEFADLVMVGGKEIEYSITRLSQKARAIGIHLVIATQRPSTDVVTGLIKNNFPTRIALKVMSVADSKTIIDTTGANQLIGKGDMLYLYGSNLKRLQCAFIDTEEVERITDFIAQQPGYPYPFELPEPIEDEEDSGKALQADLRKRDKLFEEAARIVVSNQYASISLLQRKMEIGFNRAARIIDQLEAAGIVGPGAGNKPREILITDLDELENRLQQIRQMNG